MGLNYLGNLNRGENSTNHLAAAQHELGWKSFIFRALHISWRECQERFLRSIGSRSSALVQVSKFIRQMWNLQHSMWKHRCDSFCTSNSGLHEEERRSIDRTLRQEYLTGRNGLDVTYNNFFRAEIDRLLNKNWSAKLQWLDSLWAERDRIRARDGL